MSNPLHEIDRLFRDGIEGRVEYPPKSLWENIESELERKTAIKYKNKYRSLKIKASVLVALFIGIVSYQEARLQLGKETGQQSRAIVPTTKPDQLAVDIPATTSLQNKDPEKNIQFDIAAVENNKVLPVLQLPEVINDMPVITFKELQVDGDRVQTTIADEIDLGAQELLRKNGDEDNTVLTNSPGNGPGIKDRQNYEQGLLRPVLSFSKIVDDDTWKEDIAAGLKPAISGPVLQGNASAKKPNYHDVDNSRYSFSIYASPNIAWTTLKDDGYQQPVGGSGGSGNGGNNGGNIGGGNNGGGNNIGGGNNNGGNNGGGNNGGGNNGGGNNGGGNNNGGASNGNNGGGIGGRGDDRNEIKQSESENIGYSVGVKLGYNVSKKISLLTGLNYMVNSTSVMPKLIFAGKDKNGNVGYRINCSSGYSFLKPDGSSNIKEGDSTIVSDTRSKVSYLGIPVVVDYRMLTSGRFSLSAFGGGQVNFLLNGKTTTVFGKGSANETAAFSNTEGLRTAYFSAIAGLNAEMRIKNNLALTLAPTGQFGLTHMNKGTSVKTRPNYLGLAAGLKLNF